MDNENNKEMISTCQYLRSEMKKGYDQLKQLRDSGEITDADLDYELARDRKAGLIFKSIMVEITVEKVNSRRIAKDDSLAIPEKVNSENQPHQ